MRRIWGGLVSAGLAVMVAGAGAVAQDGSAGTSPLLYPAPGPLPAGTYESRSLGPRIVFTVPADTWNASEDAPGAGFTLVRPLPGMRAGISTAPFDGEVYPDPCQPGTDHIAASAAALLEWVAASEGVRSAGAPEPVVVGGQPGLLLDLETVPPAGCGGMPVSWTIPVYGSFYMVPDEHARLIALDVDGKVLVIAIEAREGDWESFLSEAMEVVDSMDLRSDGPLGSPSPVPTGGPSPAT